MLALKIKENGNFMTRLLSSDTFDIFLLNEATLRMSVTWTVDGRINSSFFEDSSDVRYKFEEWKNIRPRMRDLIKGKKAPVSFQIVLQLKPQLMEALFDKSGNSRLLSTVSSLILTVRMDEKGIVLISGISRSGFTPDKNADILWDKAVSRFLDRKEIAYEALT